MNVLQAWGALLGIILGAIGGAMLASGRGAWAYAGGTVGGGLVGMLVGALLGEACWLAGAFLRAVGKIYWEVLTGRRKLPSNSTASERRYVFIFIGFALAVAVIIMIGVYFLGTDAQRSRLLTSGVGILATCVVGVLILRAHHRRHPPEKVDDEEE